MRDKTADFKTRQNSRFSKRDKTADFQNETKQPIFKTRQNSRFSKRDKTADFQNETKQPIFKTGQNECCYSQYAWNLIYLKTLAYLFVWLGRFAPFAK